jgi:tRNA (uracil-5-)-methyltransferase TRM9
MSTINSGKHLPENTRKVFNEIAPSWYNFRHRTIFQRELEELAQRWKTGRLLNVGCGHGPDFVPFKDGFELYGIDFSSKMLELARKYAEKYALSVNLKEADARRLPYADSYFDWAIAIASFHHIENSEGRLQAFEELYRALKPGGEAFITVWNRWQPRFWFKRKNTTLPWRSGEKTLYRYYYLFSYRELEKTAQQAGFKILKSYSESRYRFPFKTFSRNICLLVKKG